MFRQWWDENQIRDEYRDLVPLVVPKRAIGNGG